MLFFSGRGYYPHFMETSTFHGYYPHLVNVSAFRGYYPHFVEISTFRGYYTHFVEISSFLGYYPPFVYIIRIGHITSYLAHNGHHVLQSFVLFIDMICIVHIIHSFVLVMDIIYIGDITSYLACNVCPICHIYSSSESYWCINLPPVCDLICFSLPYSFRFVRFVIGYKLISKPICIYVPPFITSIKNSFYFPLIFLLCVLYWVLYKRLV